MSVAAAAITRLCAAHDPSDRTRPSLETTEAKAIARSAGGRDRIIMTRQSIRGEAAFIAMVAGAFVVRNVVAIFGLSAILAFAFLN
jgi:hypothetical protein